VIDAGGASAGRRSTWTPPTTTSTSAARGGQCLSLRNGCAIHFYEGVAEGLFVLWRWLVYLLDGVPLRDLLAAHHGENYARHMSNSPRSFNLRDTNDEGLHLTEHGVGAAFADMLVNALD